MRIRLPRQTFLSWLARTVESCMTSTPELDQIEDVGCAIFSLGRIEFEHLWRAKAMGVQGGAGPERATVVMDKLERSLLHLEEDYRSTVEAGMVRAANTPEEAPAAAGSDDEGEEFGEFQGGYAPLGEGYAALGGASDSDDEGGDAKAEETADVPAENEGWWDEKEEVAAAERAANGGGAGSASKALSAEDVRTIKNVMGRCATHPSAPPSYLRGPLRYHCQRPTRRISKFITFS